MEKFQTSSGNKQKILIDCRFVGGGSALGRYAEQLFINLLKLDSNFEFSPILLENYKKDIPKIIKKSNPLWTDIKHYSLSEQTKLPKLIREQNPDLIHYTHFNVPIFSEKPFVTTILDLTISRFKDKNQSFVEIMAYNFLLKQVAKRANHLITSSKETASDIRKYLKVTQAKTSVVYLGIEEKFKPQSEEKIAAFKKEYKIDYPYIMYAGQWRPHKNLLRLFKAFRMLKKNYGTKQKLVLFGKPDSRYPEIPQTIKALGLENEIIVLGFIPDDLLPAAYSGADLYVIPSLAEGFGFPPLEAMACATPVASSLISCMPEILDEAAVFFDPYDYADMAVKINTALTNQKLRSVLIQRGAHLVKKYTWQKTAENTLRIYQNVLGN